MDFNKTVRDGPKALKQRQRDNKVSIEAKKVLKLGSSLVNAENS